MSGEGVGPTKSFREGGDEWRARQPEGDCVCQASHPESDSLIFLNQRANTGDNCNARKDEYHIV